jgi:AraC-like DNA-binding protein
LCFGRSRFSDGERWLAAAVFAFSIIMLSYVLIWTRYVTIFPYLNNVWQFLTLCVGPSLYFYLKATFKEEITRREVLLHFIVPAVSLLLTLPAILRNFGVPNPFPADFWRIGSASTLLTGQLLFYAIYISLITRNEWQVDGNIRTWTRMISRGMWVYTLAFLSYFILVSTSFFNPEWDYAISFTMAVGILGIAYMGLIQKRVFRSEPITAFLPVQKYQSSSLTPGASESIRKRLEELLDEQQVFKENELRLDDLAAYLDISRHQLSQVINEHFRVNFFELVNRYRVAYVKRVLLDPHYAKHTIIQLAFEAGFNNKASFNRYFKQ